MSDPKTLSIRRYIPSDADAVWHLHNLALDAVGAHGGNGPWDDDMRRIGEEYLDSGGEFLVGELDGRIVAMGALRPTGDRRAEVKRMRVHPDHQRRGHGSAILSALEQRAGQLGFRQLHLETTTRQPAAQAFYESHGFRRSGTSRLGPFELVPYTKDI